MTADALESHKLPDTDADVCVIGTGPAGAVVGASLAAEGLRVLVLEAGDRAGGAPATRGLGEIDVGGTADVAFGRAFQLGGSTNLWAGRIAPLEPIDLAGRPWIADSSWPLSYEDLAAYYPAARNILGAPDPAGCDVGPPLGWEAMDSSAELELKRFAWAQAPFNAGRWLSMRMQELDSLAVVVDAQVLRLEQAASGAVTSAIIRRPDGTVDQAKARVFILAAGGLESVRILFNSTDHCPSGLGNQNDVLGRYFSTHPKADIATLALNRRIPANHPLFVDWPIGDGHIRYGLGLQPRAQRQIPTLNHYVQLAPLAEHRASRAFELVKGSAAITSPLINRHAVTRGVATGLGLWVFDAIGRIARLQHKVRLLVLRGFFDQFPDRDNRLERSARRDQASVPLLDIRWRFTDGDKTSVLDFLACVDRFISSHRLGSLDFSYLTQTPDWPITSIHSHFMGATRMGVDPRSSFTDADGRVHGVSNLYISGPSLFTTYGYANPVLTITALALRIAQSVLRDFAQVTVKTS